MSDSHPNDRDDSDERNDSTDRDNADGIGGLDRIGGQLTRLLDLLAELEESADTTRSGQFGTGRGVVDYRFSLKSGLGDPPAEQRRRRSLRSDRKRVRSTNTDKYLVTTRHEDDELVVAADIAGVDANDLTLGVNRATNELVIGVGDETIDRIPLPEEPIITRTTVRNQILEVRIGSTSGRRERFDG